MNLPKDLVYEVMNDTNLEKSDHDRQVSQNALKSVHRIFEINNFKAGCKSFQNGRIVAWWKISSYAHLLSHAEIYKWANFSLHQHALISLSKQQLLSISSITSFDTQETQFPLVRMQFKLGLCLLPVYGLLSLAQVTPSVPYPFLLSLEAKGETYFLQISPDDQSPYLVPRIGQDAAPSNFTLDDGILRSDDTTAYRLFTDDGGQSYKKMAFLFPHETKDGQDARFEAIEDESKVVILNPRDNGARMLSNPGAF